MVIQAFCPAQTSVLVDRKVARNPLLLLHSTVIDVYNELLIRWGESWKTKEIDHTNYPYDDFVNQISDREKYYLNKNRYDVEFNISDINAKSTIWNTNGLIYYNGIWAIPKITEKPQNWVVEININNPLWEKFKVFYSNKFNKFFVFNKKYYGIIDNNDYYNNNILMFANCQYLTLEQFDSLFSIKPFSIKPNEWCIMHNGDIHQSIVAMYNNNNKFSKCYRLSDKVQEILNNELRNIK